MSKLHIAARTAMHQAAVALANLADARNPTLDAEDMALIQARLEDMNRAFVETGLLAAPPQGELSALPELPPLPDDPAGSWTKINGQIDVQGMSADLTEECDAYSAEQMQTYARAYGMLCRGQQGGSDAWISVADRLPAVDEDGCANVWAVEVGSVGFSRSPQAGVTRYHKTLGWQPQGATGWDWVITHWMPIPELPGAAMQAQAGDAGVDRG